MNVRESQHGKELSARFTYLVEEDIWRRIAFHLEEDEGVLACNQPQLREGEEEDDFTFVRVVLVHGLQELGLLSGGRQRRALLVEVLLAKKKTRAASFSPRDPKLAHFFGELHLVGPEVIRSVFRYLSFWPCLPIRLLDVNVKDDEFNGGNALKSATFGRGRRQRESQKSISLSPISEMRKISPDYK